MRIALEIGRSRIPNTFAIIILRQSSILNISVADRLARNRLRKFTAILFPPCCDANERIALIFEISLIPQSVGACYYTARLHCICIQFHRRCRCQRRSSRGVGRQDTRGIASSVAISRSVRLQTPWSGKSFY